MNQENKRTWLLDAPEYQGGNLSENAYNDGAGVSFFPESETGRLQVISDTNAAEFHQYLDQLLRDGYRNTFSNRIHQNLFAEFQKRESLIYAYFTPCDGTARVIVDTASMPLCDFGYSYIPTGDECSTFYQYALVYDPTGNGGGAASEKKYSNCGTFCIVKLADNSIILIDGGYDFQATPEISAGVMQFLREITGIQAPQKVRVAAIFISHGHNDHKGNILNLVDYHADELIIERAIYNFPSVEFPGGGGVPFAKFGELLLKKFPNIKFIKPHTGEKFTLADLQIEVVTTHEDRVNPTTGKSDLLDYNATSTVLKLTFGKHTLMALADWGGNWTCAIHENEMAAYRGEEARLLGMYRDEKGEYPFLKADVVQVAHHAINDWMEKIYQAVDADYAFIPQADVSYDQMSHGCYRRVVDQLRAIGIPDPRIYFEGRNTHALTFAQDKIVHSATPIRCFNDYYLDLLKQYQPFYQEGEQ